MKNNIIPINRLVITRVKMGWYIGRVHGAAWFRRSRSEVVLSHRRWVMEQKAAEEARRDELLATARRIASIRGQAS